MKTLFASLKHIKLSRAAVPAMGIVAFVALALIVPSVAQATDRLIKITTLEPETIRTGNCGDPNDPNNPPEFAPLPPELAGLRGYTQECTPDDPNDPTGPGEWEIATNRWHPNTIVVNRKDAVTLEFYGVRGRDHFVQVFRPGYEIVIRDDGLQGVSGVGHPNCVFTDTGDPVPPSGAGECSFLTPRGEVTRVTLTVDKAGDWLIHCHTHGTAMQADLIVLKPPSNR